MTNFKIGLLEFGTHKGHMIHLVDNLIEYAVKSDTLGFSRFWMGEHYLSRDGLWYNPEVFMPIIAGMTEKIKIGVAGLLMSYHDSYRVALSFKQMSNLFPGRIDLGFARGAVPPGAAVAMIPDYENLARSGNIQNILFERFEKNVAATIDFLREEDKNIIGGCALVPPYRGEIPALWALSTSSKNLSKIIQLKLNYSRSLFHFKIDQLTKEKDVITEFKESFYREHGIYPQMNLAFAGICHETEKKALEASRNTGFITNNEVFGGPNKFHDTLCYYNELFGIDEFIFLNLASETSDKVKGIEQLSKVFNLC